MAEHVILLLQNRSVVSCLWIKAEVVTGNCKPFRIRFHSPLWTHPHLLPSTKVSWLSLGPRASLNLLKILNTLLPRGLYVCSFLCLVCSTPVHVACSFVSWRSLGIGLHVKQDASPSDPLLLSYASSLIYWSNRMRHPLTHYVFYLTVYCYFPTKTQA